MIELTSEGSYELKDRGTVHNITMPEDVTVLSLYDEGIVLNGRAVLVRGVERYCIHIGKPIIKKGEKVGILVRERENDVKTSRDKD